ncbi:protein of unknown function DUF533 [Desulfobulbus propionicus DSM 2032]|uniref:Protein YebE n=1 Tax=Desulfobulbus propionicus (strain ATCC 33891 / DSM 2032 / VKM B-1956 / 1pr3) TaxID=577650 RepID=A0A7U4DPR4_DESPD|nr:DUF533 domain-containing protein [Desulfobulbus propionicus]ADW18436.1 protein of unknown function DUF533 [Desulfobulbus propionicus DSM 2032]
MFDAEKLLGKIVGEVVGKSSGSWGGGKKSMLKGLGSGSGLMTIIGLGVGAYEILKQQGQKNPAGLAGQVPPPPPGGGSFTVPPPPLGGTASSPPPIPGSPTASHASAGAPLASPATGAELAVRMIQVMVAAAHADGAMDAEEERAVLDRLRGADLSQEEKMFLLNELHRPQSIEALTAGITDPSVAKTMYMLAVAAIEVDTEAERAWLDTLARQLGLSREMQSFIEEQGSVGR